MRSYRLIANNLMDMINFNLKISLVFTHLQNYRIENRDVFIYESFTIFF